MICALLGEGPSDQALLPILRWLLERVTLAEVRLVWVDSSRFPRGRTLAEKVRDALRMQPCELLFVHRDADNQPPTLRFEEIHAAATCHPHVAVVPIRMTEAWLLIDEAAIRAASGRVSGREVLDVPTTSKLEAIANPKRVLTNALKIAHGARGRRARRFNPSQAVRRLSDLVQDWSPLRGLSAFRRMEADTRAALTNLGIPLETEES